MYQFNGTILMVERPDDGLEWLRCPEMSRQGETVACSIKCAKFEPLSLDTEEHKFRLACCDRVIVAKPFIKPEDRGR